MVLDVDDQRIGVVVIGVGADAVSVKVHVFVRIGIHAFADFRSIRPSVTVQVGATVVGFADVPRGGPKFWHEGTEGRPRCGQASIGRCAVWVVTVPVSVKILPLGSIRREGVCALGHQPICVCIGPAVQVLVWTATSIVRRESVCIRAIVRANAVCCIAEAVPITVGPLGGVLWESIAIWVVLVVAHAVAVSVFPLICIVWEGVSICAVGLVTVAVAVTVGPLRGVVGEGVTAWKVGVVSIAVTVAVRGLSCIVREVIRCIGHAVTVCIEVQQANARAG